MMADLVDMGKLMLFGEIDLISSQQVYEFVNMHNARRRKFKSLEIIVNSSGGMINQCFAIIDIMTSSEIPIHTTAVGEILSSGLLIFAAGARGHRLVHRNVSVMSHQISGEVSGKIHEIESAQTDWRYAHQRMWLHLTQCSNLTGDEVRQHLLPSHDVWLTPAELIQYGLADGYK